MDGQGSTQSGATGTAGTTGTGTTGTTGTAAKPGTTGTAAKPGTTGTAEKPGTTGTPGTSPGATASSAPGARTDGAWYRLMGDAKLKEHVGQRVRITGTVTPGKDEKGADIVIHRIQPDRVSVTSIDLKPAPQLSIQTISEIAGECPKN
jgi:hypothetical protein